MPVTGARGGERIARVPYQCGRGGVEQRRGDCNARGATDTTVLSRAGGTGAERPRSVAVEASSEAAGQGLRRVSSWADPTRERRPDLDYAVPTMSSSIRPHARPVGASARQLLGDSRQRLRSHRLYGSVRSPADLRTFVEHHVVCVLDFMALLKSLQRELTCVDVPWTPTADPESARLIQSIVLDEETDVRADGRVQSHFAWYLEAMEELGADLDPIRSLLADLRTGTPLARALGASSLPGASIRFGQATAAVLERPLHVRAAVFFHGREEIIPSMFLPIVDGLAAEGLSCSVLRAYLERHIEVDGGEHGPLAEKMLTRLYRGNGEHQAEAEVAAAASLAAREALWDAITGACAAPVTEATR